MDTLMCFIYLTKNESRCFVTENLCERKNDSGFFRTKHSQLKKTAKSADGSALMVFSSDSLFSFCFFSGIWLNSPHKQTQHSLSVAGLEL
jgi:hypothetical protein